MKKSHLSLVIFLLIQLVSQAQEARRIVSLVPWMTRSIYLMGEQERLVGCTNYCPVAVADKIPVVASAVSVNIEKVLTRKPDLVFASSLIKPETIDNLKKLNLKVEYMSYPKSFDEICTDFIRIGELVGQSTKAKAIVTQQKERLAKLKASVPAGKNPKIFIQIGAKPLFCAVPNTFIDDFIQFSGGKNIAAELNTGNITREYVLKQNPDFIFIVTMGMVAREEKDAWLKYPVLSASKNNQIYILDSDKTCSPTPVLFVDALEEIIRLIYKENPSEI
ncbi:MAG: helical backbone metal receptor [Lentimicrobiaceae bacterium]|nr:helical backbone metal receptor [Lentimicrobiaceae bacterium]